MDSAAAGYLTRSGIVLRASLIKNAEHNATAKSTVIDPQLFNAVCCKEQRGWQAICL